MYNKVLVPVSLDESGTIDAAFAAAQHLAADGAEIHVLHVIEAIPAYFTTEIPQDILAERRVELEAELKDVAKKIDGSVPHVLSGSPGIMIVEFAKKIGADCIVVASHRPGLQDYFLGSTAARVVRHAQCPVHVVR